MKKSTQLEVELDKTKEQLVMMTMMLRNLMMMLVMMMLMMMMMMVMVKKSLSKETRPKSSWARKEA